MTEMFIENGNYLNSRHSRREFEREVIKAEDWLCIIVDNFLRQLFSEEDFTMLL